jgi:photosystem II stability/assembly factor-like uncharacterized protein
MKFLGSIFLLLLVISGFAQVAKEAELDTVKFPYWTQMMQDPNANFHATVSAFEKYFANRERQKGDGWKVFKRWEAFWRDRLDENGIRISPTVSAMNGLAFSNGPQTEGVTGNWQQLGPMVRPVPNGQPTGLGRVNAIEFAPNSTQTVYAGAPAGGLWKSVNRGQTWVPLTDRLPTLGVSAITVDRKNASKIYIGTGDRDADDSRGMGVWKSTDGGTSWNPISNGMGDIKVSKILVHYQDSNLLLAATERGVFRTTNGGGLWTSVGPVSVFCKDMVVKPNDSNVVYLAGAGVVYKSYDFGRTWSALTTGIGVHQHIRIAVTPANSNYLYVLAANVSSYDALYRSTDAGATFTRMSTSPNILDWSTNGSGTGGQSWYDLDIAADPEFANIIYVGGVNVWKSADGGANWNIIAHWVGAGAPAVHADHHILEFNITDYSLWDGCDGGVYYTTNRGNSWNSVTDGLAITQSYKIGQSATNTNLVIGNQDNGSYTLNGTNWNHTLGGDGMECAIDPTNSSYVYAEVYYGDVSRSTNGGASSQGITGSISGEEGDWVTPFEIHRSNSNVMFLGYKNLWKTSNLKANSAFQVNWRSITPTAGIAPEDNIRAIDQSPVNNDILYFATGRQHLTRSDNVNATNPSWVPLSNNLPGRGRVIVIATDFRVQNRVNIIQGNRVYRSEDKGVTWTDISGNLPNVKMNTLAVDSSEGDALYLGTDGGVYYRDTNTVQWIRFSNGLPDAVAVTELEIYHSRTNRSQSLLRAGTYGRGVWQTSLFSIARFPSAQFATSTGDTVGCTGFPVTLINQSTNYPKNNRWIVTPNTVSFVNGTTSRSLHPQIIFNVPGLYSIKLIATNNLGSDSVEKINYINISNGPQIPFGFDFDVNNQFYFQSREDQKDWTVQAGRTTLNSGPLFGKSGSSTDQYLVFFDALNPMKTDTAKLESDCFSVFGKINPTLEFWYMNFGTHCQTLSVEVNDRGGWRKVWEIVGNGPRKWQLAQIPLNPAWATMKFRLVGVNGGSDGVLALDEVRVYERMHLHDLAVLPGTRTGNSNCGLSFLPNFSVKNTGTDTINSGNVQVRVGALPAINVPFNQRIVPGDTLKISSLTPLLIPSVGTYWVEYQAQLTGDGNAGNDLMKEERAFSISPAAPLVRSDTFCLGESIFLPAMHSGDSLFWYQESDSNRVIFVGDTFRSSPLMYSNGYLAQSAKYATLTTGLDTSFEVDSFGVQPNAIVFDVLANQGITLKSFWVKSDVGGSSATFRVISRTGKIWSHNQNVGSGWSKFSPQWFLPSDSGYRLELVGVNGNARLGMSVHKGTYPMEIAQVLQIDGSPQGIHFWPFAYSWEVSFASCVSSKVKVGAFVASKPTLRPNQTLFRIGSGGSTQINVIGGVRYQWIPSTGISNPTAGFVTASPSVTTTYQVVGYNSEGCSDTVQITVEVAQGVPALEQFLQVYPNPSSGVFQLNFKEGGITMIRVENGLGQLVWQQKDVAGAVALNLDLRSQPNGIYHLSFIRNGVGYHLKLVKGIK